MTEQEGRKKKKGFKKWKFVVGVVIAYAVLCAVMLLSRNIPGVTNSGGTYGGVGNSSSSTSSTYLSPVNLSIAVKEVEHGEDGVIEWEDEGMEQHVRLWLDRQEGDILRSDVWDLRYVSIGTSYDVALEFPADKETFIYETDYLNEENRIRFETELEDIESLADLFWFESLQSFSFKGDSAGGRKDLNIAGVENCDNLEYFAVGNCRIVNIESLSEMKNLVTFSAESVSDLDLSPLSYAESLQILELDKTSPLSLEPLQGLNLTHLYIVQDLMANNNNLELDYSTLSSLKELVALNLNGIDDLAIEDLEYLQDLDQLVDLYLMDTGIGNSSSVQEQVKEMLPQVKNIYF